MMFITNEVLVSIFLPLAGTVLGAACVFFVRRELGQTTHHILLGLAAGVMTAASVWSLLIPAMDQAEDMGKWAFVPAALGLCIGFLFLLLMDHLIPHLHNAGSEAEGPKSKLPKSAMMVLAVILHNIPEGMAVGVVCAGWLSGQSGIGMTAVLALALGIAIQNFPEGAIVSLPLRSEGVSRSKSFAWGALSGIVEPIGTILTILLAGLLIPVLPYLLGFAAGAMLYVVVEDLIPEMSTGKHSNIGTLCFAAGFVIMMALDVALG